ncbi:MAG: tRNA pseudouridine(55) synthase TruB [Campylobacter sp.]|nr:tRNA pseudouridine(55) synthase TruB [Campylobacter sp.]
MNAIFVANKPSGLSSNQFLSRLKRKYGVKKAGFSGTLDPFASGCLIVAFGSYTKFFRFLNKSPKIYEATMWIGAKSKSGDNENITEVKILKPFANESLEIARKSLLGKLKYAPPKFSAKNINGTRAYKLARAGNEFELKEQEMEVFGSEILNYNHPFLTFRVSVSERASVRSYSQLIAKTLGFDASLSSLKRLSEGKFRFENEKFLDICDCLELPQNKYLGDITDILDGKSLNLAKFYIQKDGVYLLDCDKFLSVIEIKNDTINYCLNKVEKC